MSKVTFLEEKCKGCSLCVSVCPKTIIQLDDEKLNAKGYNPAFIAENDQEKCIACAMCAKMCPDCVITVEKN